MAAITMATTAAPTTGSEPSGGYPGGAATLARPSPLTAGPTGTPLLARVRCYAPVAPPVYRCHVADRLNNVAASCTVPVAVETAARLSRTLARPPITASSYGGRPYGKMNNSRNAGVMWRRPGRCQTWAIWRRGRANHSARGENDDPLEELPLDSIRERIATMAGTASQLWRCRRRHLYFILKVYRCSNAGDALPAPRLAHSARVATIAALLVALLYVGVILPFDFVDARHLTAQVDARVAHRLHNVTESGPPGRR